MALFVFVCICREISFKLNFGCNITRYIDEGIRLEVRLFENDWLPVRFYSVTMNETEGSVVKSIGNNMVVAEALTYSSNFPLEIISDNHPVLIHEYICDPVFTEGNVSVRWLQRYSETPVEGRAAWSLDDIVLTIWNGHCRSEVFHDSFDQNFSQNSKL